MPDIAWREQLSSEETAQLIKLLTDVAAEDGKPTFDPTEGLPGGYRHGDYGLATQDGRLVGVTVRNVHGDSFCHQVAELVVAPDARGNGVGTALLAALLERVGPRGQRPENCAQDTGGETLRVWAHGDHPAAAALAARFRLDRVRELRRMRLILADVEFAAPRPHEDVALRAFVIGQDEAEVVAVNHRAFSWHPEQGALTVEDLRADEAAPWFDPAGFFLAVDAADGHLLGFHWTKVHSELDGGGAPMGEVYVVGVDPDAAGKGLGTALTLAGLHHLADLGCRQIMLYVESDNAAAITVYSRLGFTQWDADVQYAY